MYIAEGAFVQNALHGDRLIFWQLQERCGPARVTRLTCRAERTARRFEVLGQQDGMVVLENVATTGIRFGTIGQQLTAR